LQSKIATEGLENWIGHRYHNLLEGAYWLAKQTYPKLHLEDMQVVVNDICKDVWINLQDEMSPEEKIKTLDFFFFRQHHFRLSSDENLLPQYNYINNVINSHKGGLVSLTLLYLYVGQQAGLPLQAVCMPNSFMMAYTGKNEEILFYLHVLHQGVKLYRKDIDLYLNRSNIKPKEHYYQSKPNTVALLYLLEMLIYCYEREGNQTKIEQFRRLLPLFDTNKSAFNDID
jgi:regulator of sirC expression with transglutaminase-like and TPR domain